MLTRLYILHHFIILFGISIYSTNVSENSLICQSELNMHSSLGIISHTIYKGSLQVMTEKYRAGLNILTL